MSLMLLLKEIFWKVLKKSKSLKNTPLYPLKARKRDALKQMLRQLTLCMVYIPSSLPAKTAHEAFHF
jgi:hypothetical protein